jgi:hypothetical protein
MRLLVSNKPAAVRFARAFSTERGGEPRQRADSASRERARRRAEAEAERIGSLLKIFDLSESASRKSLDLYAIP